MIFRMVAISFTVMVLLFAAALSTSPAVRAATLDFLYDIGVLRITETKQFPNPEIGEDTIDTIRLVYSLEEALNVFPSRIAVPAFTPHDFERQPEVEIVKLENHMEMARLIWLKREIALTENGDEIETVTYIHLEILHLPNSSPNTNLIVGPGAVEGTEINGQPAAIVRGVWDVENQAYHPGSQVSVHWQFDPQTIYTLSANEDHVSVTTLLEMAASVP